MTPRLFALLKRHLICARSGNIRGKNPSSCVDEKNQKEGKGAGVCSSVITLDMN